MNKLLIGIGAAALLAAVIVLFPILGVLIGALSGWVVGWFFEETILGFLAALGVTGFKMWQVGASLGFLGSFFKSVNYNSK